MNDTHLGLVLLMGAARPRVHNVEEPHAFEGEECVIRGIVTKLTSQNRANSAQFADETGKIRKRRKRKAATIAEASPKRGTNADTMGVVAHEAWSGNKPVRGRETCQTKTTRDNAVGWLNPGLAAGTRALSGVRTRGVDVEGW